MITYHSIVITYHSIVITYHSIVKPSQLSLARRGPAPAGMSDKISGPWCWARLATVHLRATLHNYWQRKGIATPVLGGSSFKLNLCATGTENTQHHALNQEKHYAFDKFCS